METARTWRAASLGVGLVLVLVAACGGGTDTSAGVTPTTTTPTPGTTVSPTKTATRPATTAGSSADPATDLHDGRHAARIGRVDADGRQVTVDVVQLFLGEAAARAAAEDQSPEVPPANDVWVRNENVRVRTLPVASELLVTVNVHGADLSGSAVKDTRISLDQLAGIRDVGDGVFWLTLSDGRVTRIAEQYLP